MSKLFALVLVACVAVSSASVLFHKSVDTEFFGKNVPATVQLKIYNLGSEDVFDVIVQDKWPKDHFTVVGSMSNKFEMIEAGSNITHTFTVEPTFEGFYSADRAALSYRETREADPTVSYSNPMHNMSVLPNAVYQRLTNKHSFEWTIYVIGLLATVGVPLAAWMHIQASSEFGVPKSKLARAAKRE